MAKQYESAPFHFFQLEPKFIFIINFIVLKTFVFPSFVQWITHYRYNLTILPTHQNQQQPTISSNESHIRHMKKCYSFIETFDRWIDIWILYRNNKNSTKNYVKRKIWVPISFKSIVRIDKSTNFNYR